MRQQLNADGAVLRFTGNVTASPRPGDNSFFRHVESATISLANVGRAVASSIHGVVTVTIKEIPGKRSVRNLTWQELHSRNLEIVPYPSTSQPESRVLPFAVSAQEDAQINAGHLAIYIEGTVEYDNGFGTIVPQQICYAYWFYPSRDLKGVIVSRGGRTVTCAEFDTALAYEAINQSK
jgi:hypothetical protein